MSFRINSPRRLAGASVAAIAAVVALLASVTVGFTKPATRKVAIRFRPMVGAEAFACGKSYTGIGATGATLTPSDFGMYVYDVRLRAADGTDVPVTLEQDGLYQNENLALLDFEDGTGPCGNGNATMHTEVTGSVPEGRYTGVSFTVGVPFERNHLDLTTQPPPLSITRMFWAWNTGHKFLRFDAKSSTGKNWVMHLGSTGCAPTGSATVVPTACAQANRTVVTLTGFNVDADAIIADAGQIFAGNGVVPDSSQVCMSSPKSASCAPMFAKLGMSFNGSAPQVQSLFRVAPGALKANDR